MNKPCWHMNPIYEAGEDPAADLWPAENEAWARYRGHSHADPADRAAWREIMDRIEQVRADAGWPRLRKVSP